MTIIVTLDPSKPSESNHIPTTITQNNSNIFSNCFQASFNNAIVTDTFQTQIKYADVKPDYK